MIEYSSHFRHHPIIKKIQTVKIQRREIKNTKRFGKHELAGGGGTAQLDLSGI